MGTLLKSAVIIFLVIFGGRGLVPNILHQIVHTRGRELFVITIILLCLGTALFTSWLGLSLALGAFLAGLIISESEYAYQAFSDILTTALISMKMLARRPITSAATMPSRASHYRQTNSSYILPRAIQASYLPPARITSISME